MTPEHIAALQSLIQADPALAQQLQSATSIDSAAQMLAQATNQKGIAIDASAIAEYMEAAKDVQMSDDELEAVAGGLITRQGFMALSILTIGIGCQLYSASYTLDLFEKCTKTKS